MRIITFTIKGDFLEAREVKKNESIDKCFVISGYQFITDGETLIASIFKNKKQIEFNNNPFEILKDFLGIKAYKDFLTNNNWEEEAKATRLKIRLGLPKHYTCLEAEFLGKLKYNI